MKYGPPAMALMAIAASSGFCRHDLFDSGNRRGVWGWPRQSVWQRSHSGHVRREKYRER